MEETQQILLENKEKVTSCIFVMRANFLEEMTCKLRFEKDRCGPVNELEGMILSKLLTFWFLIYKSGIVVSLLWGCKDSFIAWVKLMAQFLTHRLSRWLSDKDPLASAGDVGSIPGLGRSPGEGNGHPLQYSWGNSMDKGAWRAVVRGVAKNQTWLNK